MPIRLTTRSSRFGGFTLIELLVVIGIIGLLLSILLPTLSRARSKSMEIVCKSNLREVGHASRLYTNDYDDHLPDPYTLGGVNYRGGPGWRDPDDPFSPPEIYGLPALFHQLGYIEVNEAADSVWICPGQPTEMQSNWNTYAWNMNPLVTQTSLFRGNEDYLNTFWVFDNYFFVAFTPGVRRGDGDIPSFISPQNWIYPHEFQTPFNKTESGKSEGSINVLYLDGAVGVTLFKARPGETSPSKICLRG